MLRLSATRRAIVFAITAAVFVNTLAVSLIFAVPASAAPTGRVLSLSPPSKLSSRARSVDTAN